MRNKRVPLSAILVFVAALAGAAPYATITFAEGASFILVRNNVSSVWAVSDAKVFGMEIKPGDIINTSGSTFLEIFVQPIRATVQIAENTSYRCEADATGTKSSGELFYGRVRAKVAKLSADSSFKISSPTLVAGVRGTDFGCDVIAPRTADDPVLHRVFCFEGNIAVRDSAFALAPTMVIGANEMVEVAVPVTAATTKPSEPKKSVLNEEVRDFWGEHPMTGVALPATPKVRVVDGLTITDRVWPEGVDQKIGARNLAIPGGALAVLAVAGSALCVGTAAFAQASGASFSATPLYLAGGIMIGSGSLLGLVSSIFK